jgi:glycosyltransferase involved in cell wall biosynthesis
VVCACNFINSRKRILLWDFHEKAFAGIPVCLVSHNPRMAGVTAAESWTHLKDIFQSHRFYVHTADARLEAGYNMASMEALAAGMPVLGSRRPTSPVKHGISGFLSDNPDELRKYARMLLEDKRLAELMGQQARRTVMEHFSTTEFKRSFVRSIETARMKWQSRDRAMIRRSAVAPPDEAADPVI